MVINMPNARYRESPVKYTALLPKECIEELEILADRKIIPSVDQGICLAVENFVFEQKQRTYEKAMREAASDKTFITRTLESQADFAAADAEVETGW